jgi:hypothetical protein
MEKLSAEHIQVILATVQFTSVENLVSSCLHSKNGEKLKYAKE